MPNRIAFEEAYKGKLAALAAGADAGAKLAEAVRRYEALDDLLGRLISYASLVYAGNTTDPARAKFYGDMQEKITRASLHLLFFTLELNRIDDAALERAMGDPALGHYRPWLEDIRKEKPYQLEDRVEELFHEKSVTGAGAWNRLFDETLGALRFEVDGKPLAIEATLSLMQDADGRKRRAASEALARTFKANLRTFTLITNTLAKDKEISDRWRGFKDIADARHLSNRVEPEVVEALVAAVRAAYPRLSHRYYALKASWFGKKQLCRIGTATRRCRRSNSAPSAGARRATPCSAPMGRSRRAWRKSPSASSRATGSTRRRGRASRPARSRIRPCRRRTLTCCSTIRASRAT